MDKSPKRGFGITNSRGFHVTFENGWTISVQFGPGNYCDNYGMRISEEGYVEAGKRGSSTAEMAAWDANGKWLEVDGDTVTNRSTPAEMLALMVRVAAMPAAAKVEA